MYYLLLSAISLVLALTCIITGFYIGIVSLQAFGIAYSILTIPGLIAYTIGDEEPPLKEQIKAFLTALTGLLIITFISVLIGAALPLGVAKIVEWPAKPPPTTIMWIAGTLNISPPLLLSLILQIPAGTGEESFFRIFLLKTLTPVMGEKYPLVASALIFGVMHYLAYQASIPLLIGAIRSGYLLSLIYQTTKAATAICLAHSIYNLIAIIGGG